MGQDTNVPTGEDEEVIVAGGEGDDTTEQDAGAELAELQGDLCKVQAATVSDIDKTLSTISSELKKLDLVVNTEEARISLAQAISSYTDEYIAKLTRILNTSDSEGYKTIILAKQNKATEMKSTADAYISKNVDEKDKVTPPGSTNNSLYQNAKITTGGYKRKF